MSKSGRLDQEVDELFKLPLAEFIAARDALVKRLKLNGRTDDAALVKALAKPPVSAWTVNQLYWNHRSSFEQLLAAGQRFHKAQMSASAGKVANMRGSLEARRQALAELADLAESVLSEAGHNPSLDTIRRITTTLEAVSAYASVSDGPTLGRLSQDVDPPGFESLASFVSGGGALKGTPKSLTASKQTTREVRQLEQTRQIRIAAAKGAVQVAKKSLADSRARAQGLEAAHKKTYAEAKQAEKQLRDAEDRVKNARIASEAADRRAKSVAGEAADAAKTVEDARRALEEATRELESLFSELPKS